MEEPRVGIGVIVHDRNRVLLGLRRNAHGEGNWGFAGGHLEFGESVFDCAKREVEEETGLMVREFAAGPYTNDIFQSEGKHYITLFILCKYEGGEPEIREPNKCERWEWFEWSELPKNLFLPILNLLEQGFKI